MGGKGKVTPTRSEYTRAAHREAAAKYRWKYRKNIREQELYDNDHVVRRKEADRKYRTKQADLLAFKQRRRRQDAYITKYGQDAYQERIRREGAARDAKWEAERTAAAREREEAARNRCLALANANAFN
ncbi:hypothetical protein C8R43DRAFT_1117838 [Mycena crocata]|nr:hypothetical protein C8R43DRAFT_1117838 [Mycena crocata]